MSKGPHHFIDQVSRVDVVNRVVRIELGVLRPGDAGEPATGAGQQAALDTEAAVLNLPLEGFLGATALFEQVINQMVEKGLLARGTLEEIAKAADGGQPAAAPAAASSQPAVASKPPRRAIASQAGQAGDAGKDEAKPAARKAKPASRAKKPS